ncbi:GNAT family N-acetyltransferase [Tahibacter amnicola]|uniref:N-acetyltransferase n=1 Tax=Tahibacter amnicola TaxID=2976241 RepID=A0ABY6BAW8_9GAMM|nr:GNAT family N-acetyltransferase [Tahibacter amnicola]UXI66676.1 N-acetyltransferase [Tahibacter amnicola]
MDDSATALTIQHDRLNGMFVAQVQGHHCHLDYRLNGDSMVITHTGVPSEVGGRGIAAALTAEAVAVAAREGWVIVPACSYVAAWLRRHPAEAARVGVRR